jgi:hypothetical protein
VSRGSKGRKPCNGDQQNAEEQLNTYLLTSCVPNIKFDGSTVGVELKRVDFHTKSGNVLLFELTRQVTLHESSLAYTSVSDKDEFELRFMSLFHRCKF